MGVVRLNSIRALLLDRNILLLVVPFRFGDRNLSVSSGSSERRRDVSLARIFEKEAAENERKKID